MRPPERITHWHDDRRTSRRAPPSRGGEAGRAARSALRMPVDPVAQRLAHHELEVASLQEGKLLREHGDAFAIGARHPGDVGSPEAPLRHEGVEDALDVVMDVPDRKSVV